MQLHERICLMRKIKEWSQEQMAERLDMSTNGYAKIERGETDVQLSRLEKIAEVFGIELKELINFDDNKILNFASSQSHFSNYVNSQIDKKDLEHQIDKQHLIIEQKDKEIAWLKEENERLKEIIGLLKIKTPTVK